MLPKFVFHLFIIQTTYTCSLKFSNIYFFLPVMFTCNLCFISVNSNKVVKTKFYYIYFKMNNHVYSTISLRKIDKHTCQVFGFIRKPILFYDYFPFSLIFNHFCCRLQYLEIYTVKPAKSESQETGKKSALDRFPS